MYGKNCHDKDCRFNTGKLGMQTRCSHPNKKAFMLCEKPSREQIDRILEKNHKISEADCTIEMDKEIDVSGGYILIDG